MKSCTSCTWYTKKTQHKTRVQSECEIFFFSQLNPTLNSPHTMSLCLTFTLLVLLPLTAHNPTLCSKRVLLSHRHHSTALVRHNSNSHMSVSLFRTHTHLLTTHKSQSTTKNNTQKVFAIERQVEEISNQCNAKKLPIRATNTWLVTHVIRAKWRLATYLSLQSACRSQLLLSINCERREVKRWRSGKVTICSLSHLVWGCKTWVSQYVAREASLNVNVRL